VVDIDLQVVAGALKGNDVPLGDGVNQNDVQFLNQFPYVAPPKPGANPDAAYGSQLKAIANADGTDTLPSYSATGAGGAGGGGDGGGPSAIGWIAIVAGALLLAGLTFRLTRRRKGVAAA
jgi:uncharacterized protein DUF4331